MAAAFGRALAAGAAKQENNNANIGNTTNVWPVANLPANQIQREQRAIEEYTRIERELSRVSSQLRQCETTFRSAPQEMAEASAIIDNFRTKANLTNREGVELRRAYADLIRIQNNVQGCQAEMADLLAKKRQLNTEEFFQSRWVKNTKNISAFNKPVRGAGGGATHKYSSMVGGGRRRRKTRRK
jgi:hypothetical protein